MSLDIPGEMYLSRNIQTMTARAKYGEAPPEEALAALVTILAGAVMELEERLLAAEKQLGIPPRKVADVPWGRVDGAGGRRGPDLASRVVEGAVTANAAALQKGWRKPADRPVLA